MKHLTERNKKRSKKITAVIAALAIGFTQIIPFGFADTLAPVLTQNQQEVSIEEVGETDFVPAHEALSGHEIFFNDSPLSAPALVDDNPLVTCADGTITHEGSCPASKEELEVAPTPRQHLKMCSDGAVMSINEACAEENPDGELAYPLLVMIGTPNNEDGTINSEVRDQIISIIEDLGYEIEESSFGIRATGFGDIEEMNAFIEMMEENENVRYAEANKYIKITRWPPMPHPIEIDFELISTATPIWKTVEDSHAYFQEALERYGDRVVSAESLYMADSYLALDAPTKYRFKDAGGNILGELVAGGLGGAHEWTDMEPVVIGDVLPFSSEESRAEIREVVLKDLSKNLAIKDLESAIEEGKISIEFNWSEGTATVKFIDGSMISDLSNGEAALVNLLGTHPKPSAITYQIGYQAPIISACADIEGAVCAGEPEKFYLVSAYFENGNDAYNLIYDPTKNNQLRSVTVSRVFHCEEGQICPAIAQVAKKRIDFTYNEDATITAEIKPGLIDLNQEDVVWHKVTLSQTQNDVYRYSRIDEKDAEGNTLASTHFIYAITATPLYACVAGEECPTPAEPSIQLGALLRTDAGDEALSTITNIQGPFMYEEIHDPAPVPVADTAEGEDAIVVQPFPLPPYVLKVGYSAKVTLPGGDSKTINFGSLEELLEKTRAFEKENEPEEDPRITQFKAVALNDLSKATGLSVEQLEELLESMEVDLENEKVILQFKDGYMHEGRLLNPLLGVPKVPSKVEYTLQAIAETNSIPPSILYGVKNATMTWNLGFDSTVADISYDSLGRITSIEWEHKVYRGSDIYCAAVVGRSICSPVGQPIVTNYTDNYSYSTDGTITIKTFKPSVLNYATHTAEAALFRDAFAPAVGSLSKVMTLQQKSDGKHYITKLVEYDSSGKQTVTTFSYLEAIADCAPIAGVDCTHNLSGVFLYEIKRELSTSKVNSQKINIKTIDGVTHEHTFNPLFLSGLLGTIRLLEAKAKVNAANIAIEKAQATIEELFEANKIETPIPATELEAAYALIQSLYEQSREILLELRDQLDVLGYGAYPWNDNRVFPSDSLEFHADQAMQTEISVWYPYPYIKNYPEAARNLETDIQGRLGTLERRVINADIVITDAETGEDVVVAGEQIRELMQAMREEIDNYRNAQIKRNQEREEPITAWFYPTEPKHLLEVFEGLDETMLPEHFDYGSWYNFGIFNDMWVYTHGLRAVGPTNKDFQGILTKFITKNFHLVTDVTSEGDRTINADRVMEHLLHNNLVHVEPFGDGTFEIRKSTNADGTESLKAAIKANGEVVEEFEIKSFDVQKLGTKTKISMRDLNNRSLLITAYETSSAADSLKKGEKQVIDGLNYAVTNTYALRLAGDTYVMQKTMEDIITRDGDVSIWQKAQYSYDRSGSLVKETVDRTKRESNMPIYSVAVTKSFSLSKVSFAATVRYFDGGRTDEQISVSDLEEFEMDAPLKVASHDFMTGFSAKLKSGNVWRVTFSSHREFKNVVEVRNMNGDLVRTIDVTETFEMAREIGEAMQSGNYDVTRDGVVDKSDLEYATRATRNILVIEDWLSYETAQNLDINHSGEFVMDDNGRFVYKNDLREDIAIFLQKLKEALNPVEIMYEMTFGYGRVIIEHDRAGNLVLKLQVPNLARYADNDYTTLREFEIDSYKSTFPTRIGNLYSNHKLTAWTLDGKKLEFLNRSFWNRHQSLMRITEETEFFKKIKTYELQGSSLRMISEKVIRLSDNRREIVQNTVWDYKNDELSRVRVTRRAEDGSSVRVIKKTGENASHVKVTVYKPSHGYVFKGQLTQVRETRDNDRNILKLIEGISKKQEKVTISVDDTVKVMITPLNTTAIRG